MSATDREIYEYARKHYSPTDAIKVWNTLLRGNAFSEFVRRCWQREMEREGHA